MYLKELKITVWRSMKKNANCLCPELNISDKLSLQMVDDLVLQSQAQKRDMPIPRNETKLWAFLGFANYDHGYIPNMYELSSPLNNLFKKEIKWDWFGLVWFYGISTFVGYLMPNRFLCK